MPDLRYHLISLISVFLALAIGILLGVAMSDRGIISDRLQVEVTNVRNQLNKQQTEIDEREAEIDLLRRRTTRDQQLSEDMAQSMISGKLKGENIAVVAGPWSGQGARSVEAALAEAGANVTSNIPLDPPDRAEITSTEVTNLEKTTSSTNIYADETAEILDAPKDAEIPKTVVFVGGGRVPADAPPGSARIVTTAQRDLLDVWTRAGLDVVGAEASYSGRSEIELFQNAGIPSVDNVDQPAGQAALIIAIDEDLESGSYGIKETASDLFPPARS